MAKNQLVKYSVVDAFTDAPFKGNPAAVCLLEEERGDQWLQSVAAEFNISETCYLTRITESDPHDSPNGNAIPKFRLRWFTPVAEMNLCGHATLAAAHTLFTSGKIDSKIIEFVTLSGILTAKKVPEIKTCVGSNVQTGEAKESYLIELNFPVDTLAAFDSAEAPLVSKALGGASVIDIKKTTTTEDLLVVFPSAKSVVDFKPEFDAIKEYRIGRGIIITAVSPPDSGFDFYSRFFCPQFGINEDPVCGSAHCALAPYWRKELGKCDFVANAASPRGGVVNIHLDEQNQRVLLRGKAFTVMEGTLLV
ncbi:hypothetical protein UlMin_031399 [Ulmus minor]